MSANFSGWRKSYSRVLAFVLLQMPLNWDVLLEVMWLLSRADASRMSRTCRTLLRGAPRALLSCDGWARPAIALWKDEQFASFSTFMLVRPRDSFRYLRHLSLNTYHRLRAQPGFAKTLAAVFTHATQLETLSLSDGEILEIDQHVGDAFVQMKSLRVLKIGDFSTQTIELLAKMQTPLVCIHANFTRSIFDRVDPVPILAPFRDSLRHVAVTWVDFTSSETQFPHVVSLDTELCAPEGLEEIVQCFPNLQELYMDTGGEELWNDSEIEELRPPNWQSQAVHTWPSLSSLSGSVATLYVLGVRCHVTHIDVSCDILRKPIDGERLAAVLIDARPMSLSLQLQAWEFDVASLVQYLLPAKDSLVKLTLRIRFRGEQYEDPSPHIVCSQLTKYHDVDV